MKLVFAIIASAGLLTSGGAIAVTQDEAMALAKRSGCLACHSIEAKMVGPAWRDVAKKYAGDAAAQERLVGIVRKGGNGTWGPVPMPPNVTVKMEDVKILVEFVLGLK